MSSGVVSGGWGYVVAAYAVTAVVLIAYGLTLYLRLRKEAARIAREQDVHV